MISLLDINDFFTLILPMFEFLLVFAGILFLIHLKTRVDHITEYFRSIATDLRRIADNGQFNNDETNR